MEIIATLNAKVDTVLAAIQAAGNPNPPPSPSLATQDELDALGAKIDTVAMALAPKLTPPSNP